MEPTVDQLITKHDLKASEMKLKCAPSVRARIATELIDWKMIALHLGFTQAKIHAIHADHEDEEQRRAAFLEAWSHDRGERATYLELAEAFYHHGRWDLVDHLCKITRRALRYEKNRPAGSKESRPEPKNAETKVRVPKLGI